MLRFLTAGESHGKSLVSILDGFPSGLKLDLARINMEMHRRQQGFGRSARQKLEQDTVEFVGGVRHGRTTGAPLALLIPNKDHWEHVMSVFPPDLSDPDVQTELKKKSIQKFRPGHADLPGTLKYRQQDIRDVLERASARETAARVAVGSICEQLLEHCGIAVVGTVIQVASTQADRKVSQLPLNEIRERSLNSQLFCADPEIESAMIEVIEQARHSGDTIGGIVEIQAEGCPIGLGSYAQWDKRLDGELAQALMSVQAIKAVEIGDGISASALTGSQVHDALYSQSNSNDGADGARMPFYRLSNHAGGIEGGMTNGERVIVRAFMKPIPTLVKGLPSVSFPEYQQDTAHFERSDVCAIAAASVVAKAMVCFVLARAMLDKFGGDAVLDIETALAKYRADCTVSKVDIFAK